MSNINSELYLAASTLLRCFPQDEAAALCGVTMSEVMHMRFGEEPADAIPLRRCLHLAAVLDTLIATGFTPLSAARWFYLPSSEMSGNAPIIAYSGNWTPEEPAPRYVLKVAQSLRR